jgi:hypothetical protein
VLSAVLYILDAAGERLDKALRKPDGGWYPTVMKLGAGLIAGGAVRNGATVETTVQVDTSVIATKAYADSVASAAQTAAEAYAESLMDTTVPKSITLSANNTTATVDIFTVTGVGIEIVALIGLVTTGIGSNHTASQIVAYDGSTTVDVTATGADPLSAAAVGTVLAAISATNPLAIVDRSAVSAGDSTPNAPLISVFTKTGATTKIQYKYTTTNAPTSGAITWYLTYKPIADGAAVAA